MKYVKNFKHVTWSYKVNISVIIPTYNRASFVEKAVISVLAQTHKASEIIIVDDGSTDDTKERLSTYPITYIYQENKGVSSARNTGIKHAKYPWLAFLDSDDLWDADKLKQQVHYHQKNTEILISQTHERWQRNGKFIHVAKAYQKKERLTFEASMQTCLITASSLLTHQSVFHKVGMFDESLVVCEDYDMWLRMLREYQVGLIDATLITKVAGHEEQLSFAYVAMDIYRVEALFKHLESPYGQNVKSLIKTKLNILQKGAIKHENNALMLKLLKLNKKLVKMEQF